MIKLLMVTQLLMISSVAAQQQPGNVPDEQTKILALKLGYILNGGSMVRWGSIDLSKAGDPLLLEPEASQPPAPVPSPSGEPAPRTRSR